MPLLQLRNVTISYGGPPLLDQASLTLEVKERICLIGRNGTGKSTLLKMISQQLMPDSGVIERDSGLRVGYLSQEVPADSPQNVFDLVASGAGPQGQLLICYHHLSQQVVTQPELLPKLAEVQHQLESQNGWHLTQQTELLLSRLQLDGDARFGDLSGGLKRRVLLAQALAANPDLLLLDEPTNHLDITAIQWLESFLLDFKGTVLLISHDRRLLQALATRIVELDRGQLYSYPGDYAAYLQRKQAFLAAEEKANAEFDKKLAQEEIWIRQGIKARRTRNEGRVRALEALREQRQQRRAAMGTIKWEAPPADYAGKLVIEATNIRYAYGNQAIIAGFSTRILRGDRVGILGANGSGKTTLLRLLLGQLKPQQGEVKLGTQLQIAYFDQHRQQLDLEKSVQENISSSQMITLGNRSRHIVSYLQDFLFSPERIRSPVKALSGGERNRLLLAKLFAQPANLLVMDEPTNDLDIETLELLEEQLLNYAGTLLLVSHDRAFIDHTVTSTIVFEQGQLNEYVGGYQDWLRQRQQPVADSNANTHVKKSPQGNSRARPGLGYREQQELKQLPQRIEALEQEQQQLQQQLADPRFYQQEKSILSATHKRLATLALELEQAYQRWAVLEDLALK